MKRSPLVLDIAVSCILAAVFCAVSLHVSEAVPKPYMDETLHVPQSRAYCRGKFNKWNPKITTFPGLYLLHAGVDRVVRLAGLPFKACSVSGMRVINAALAGLCLFLMLRIRRRLHGGASLVGPLAHVLPIALLPTHAFFAFLAYTDVPALAACLLVHWAALPNDSDLSLVQAIVEDEQGAASDNKLLPADSAVPPPLVVSATPLAAERIARLRPRSQCRCGSLRHWFTAFPPERAAVVTVLGVVSILMRQTGVAWLCFSLATSALAVVHTTHPHALRWSPFPQPVIALLRMLPLHLPALLLTFVAPLMLVAAFAAFVWFNGSVVVGDHANHEPRAHLSQLLYFAVFSLAAMGFDALTGLASFFAGVVRGVARPSFRSLLGFLLLLGASGYVAWAHSYLHPFLESDNRHYASALARRLLGGGEENQWLRVAVAPLYAIAAWVVGSVAARRMPFMWLAAFVVATAAVLVPSPLIEFRYFTTPAVLLMLHMPQRSTTSAIVTTIMFAAALAASVYVFVHMPFTWADGSVARRMW